MAQYSPKTQVDFVIIGSGAAGGVMAKELSSAGFHVVVLEQGPYLREKDFKYDEQDIRTIGPLVNDRQIQPNTFRKTEKRKGGGRSRYQLRAVRRRWNGSLYGHELAYARSGLCRAHTLGRH